MYDFRDMSIAVLGDTFAGLYTAYMMAKDRYTVHFFPSQKKLSLPLVLQGSTLRSFLLFHVFQQQFQQQEITSLEIYGPNGAKVLLPLKSPLYVFDEQKVCQLFKEKLQETRAEVHSSPVECIREEEFILLSSEGKIWELDFLIHAELAPSGCSLKAERHSLLLWASFPTTDLSSNTLKVFFFPQEHALGWALPTHRGWHLFLWGLGPAYLRPLWEERLHDLARVLSLPFCPEPEEIWLPWIPSHLLPNYCMGPFWASIGRSCGVFPLTVWLQDGDLLSAYHLCDSFAKMRPTAYAETMVELAQQFGQVEDILPHLQNSQKINLFLSLLQASPWLQEELANLLAYTISPTQFLQKVRQHFLSLVTKTIFRKIL